MEPKLMSEAVRTMRRRDAAVAQEAAGPDRCGILVGFWYPGVAEDGDSRARSSLRRCCWKSAGLGRDVGRGKVFAMRDSGRTGDGRCHTGGWMGTWWSVVIRVAV